MNYLEFAKNKPTLKRELVGESGDVTEIFKPFWNKYSNSLCYFRLSKNGRKTNFGYTLMKTFRLFSENKLKIAL